MENTAKVYILGAAAVIVSGVKLEDWKRAEKYAPEALLVVNEEGEPRFRVATSSGTGYMNQYGVVWGNYPTEEGMATVTILLEEDVEDKKEAVTEVIGSALVDLAVIEKAMPEILEKIDEKGKEIEGRLIIS